MLGKVAGMILTGPPGPKYINKSQSNSNDGGRRQGRSDPLPELASQESAENVKKNGEKAQIPTEKENTC